MDTSKIRLAITLLVSTIIFGTAGYYIVEGMPLFDAFYMTLITISTVGFSEIRPLTTPGRIVTIFIIITGTATLAYTVGTILRMFIEGEISKTFGRRKVEKHISKIKNHYIICGYGRIGRIICDHLKNNNVDFVVIENTSDCIDQLEREKYKYIAMDATNEEALFKAGIMNARGIVTAVQSEADNVFITLSARGIRPDIFIMARSSDERSEDKLKRAGASKVISPYQIGGKRMAEILVRPNVIDFVDIALMGNNLGLVMEESVIRYNSSLIGKNLLESNLRKDYGVIIVAIRKKNGEMIFNPTSQEVLEKDDIIVLLGRKEDVQRMNQNI